MPDIIRLNHENYWIDVTSEGEISAEELQASLAQIKALVADHDCRRILVNVSQQTSLPGANKLLEFAELLPANLCCAIVSGTTATFWYQDLFVQAAAQQGHLAKLFDTEASARAWLARQK